MSASALAAEPLFICSAGWAAIEGTREQIEREASVPPDVEWPDGFRLASWDRGEFYFCLGRCKPPGAKEHKARYKAHDWWRLHWQVRR